MRALSIRQPYAEQILRGRKKYEYRSMRTNLRERVYTYASQTADTPVAAALPRGVIVGTVEIAGCTPHGDSFKWHLRAPKRLSRPRRPTRSAQPVWFNPVWKQCLRPFTV